MSRPAIENPAARAAVNAAAAFEGQPTVPDPQPAPPQNFVPSGFAPGGHRTAPLSLAEQRQIVQRGESVLWNNRIIADARHLPSEALLAAGDPAKEAAAERNLQAEIDRLTEERDRLRAGTLTAPGAGAGPGTAVTAPAPRANDPNPPGPGLTAEQSEEIKAAQRRAILENRRPEPAVREGT